MNLLPCHLGVSFFYPTLEMVRFPFGSPLKPQTNKVAGSLKKTRPSVSWDWIPSPGVWLQLAWPDVFCQQLLQALFERLLQSTLCQPNSVSHLWIDPLWPHVFGIFGSLFVGCLGDYELCSSHAMGQRPILKGLFAGPCLGNFAVARRSAAGGQG